MRSLAIALVILAATASVSRAGIDLSWNQCVTAAPADGITWSCAPGTVSNLYANFQVPSNISGFVALDAVIDVELGTAAPAFWHYQVGGCNEAGLNVFDAPSATDCPAGDNPSPWGGGGSAADAFITGYAPGYGATNRSRLLVTVARASSSPTPLVAGQNYYGFHLAFSSDAASVCAGCTTPAEITWTSGTFFAPTGGPGGGVLSVVVTAPGLRSNKVQLNGGLSGVVGFELFSVSPTSGSVGGPLAITVTGRDILPGATLRLVRTLRPPVPATGVTVAADGRSISGSINLLGVEDGDWDVEVTNPGGATAHLAAAFHVDAGLNLTAVTPFELGDLGTFPVVVTGGGFEAGIDVRLRRSGLQPIIGSVTNIAPDGRSLNCTFFVNGAATGPWDLVATNVGGETATLVGAVRVVVQPSIVRIDPSVVANTGPATILVDGQHLDIVTGVSFEKSGQAPRVATSLSHVGTGSVFATVDFTGAALGTWDIVLTTSSIYTVRGANMLLVIQPPVIDSIVPNQAGNGVPFTATVHGQQLSPGLGIELRRAGAATLVASPVNVAPDGRSAQGTFTPNFAVIGPRDVVAKHGPVLSNTLVGAFTLLAAPRANYVTPSTGPNTGPLTLRASGSGFQAGIAASLIRSGIPDLVGTNVQVGPSDTSLTATFDLTDAAAGPWSFSVRNPNGLQSTLASAFNVIATPQIDSIVPRTGPAGAPAVPVAIYGRRFSPSLVVSLRRGATVRNATNVSVVPNGTRIDATFNLAGLAANVYDVQVTNVPGGTATLAGAFTVTPPLTISEPVPAFGLDTTLAMSVAFTGGPFQPGAVVQLTQIGQSDRTATSAIVDPGAVTATFDLRGAQHGGWNLKVTNPDGSQGLRTNAFRIDWVPLPQASTPANGVDTEVLPLVRVTGSRFEPGSQIALVRSGVPAIEAINEATTGGTEVAGSIDLRNAPLGSWDVLVRNPNNTASGTLVNALTVLVGPRITGIAPTAGEPVAVLDATVSGSGFQAGAQVALEQAGVPTISGTGEITSVDGTSIAVRFNLSSQMVGFRNVRVTNPDGHAATLPNGFHVLPGPTLTFVSPAFAPDTGAAVLAIAGQGFSPGIRTWLRRPGEPNIDGTVLSVSPQGTLLQASFDLQGKALGAWDVVIENPSLSQAALPLAFEIRYIGPTSPSGLDLTWSACNLPLSGGTSTVDFECTNPAFERTLFANFQSPVPVPDFVALDAVLDIETAAPALPEFWQFDPAGCNANGLILGDARLAQCSSFENANPWGPGGNAADAFITAYVPNYAGGGRARMLISVVRGIDDPVAIVGGENTFGFTLTWSGDLLVCAGCTTPAEITWTSAMLLSAGTAPPVTVSGPGMRSSVASVNGGLTGLGLTSVVPEKVLSQTVPRLQILGRELVGLSELRPTRTGSADVSGTALVFDLDGRGVSASFDLTTAVTGRWSLQATKGASVAELVEAVRVVSRIPEVVVLAPVAGERVIANRDYFVQWDAVDDQLVTGIDIFMSRGSFWELLAQGLSNSGGALVRIPGPISYATIRVVAKDADGNSGYGDSGVFFIESPTATLLSKFEAVRASEGAQVSWSFTTPEWVTRVDLERAAQDIGPWTLVQGEHHTQDGTTTVLDQGPGAATSRYRLRAVTRDDETVIFGPIAVSSGEVVAAAGVSGVVHIAPNPATTRMRIRLSVARAAPVRLSVLDLQGREVAVLANQELAAGKHDIAWDGRAGGRSLPPGLYFVRFVDPTRRQVTRLVLAP